MTEQKKPNWQTAKSNFYNISKTYQKELRKNPTPSEKIIWELVRNKRLNGYKFRRQHIIDVFIVDFVCLKKKLIIEIDGKIHDFQKEYDKERTLFLNEMDFQVIRFTNDQVLHNLEYVTQEILTNLNSLEEQNS